MVDTTPAKIGNTLIKEYMNLTVNGEEVSYIVVDGKIYKPTADGTQWEITERLEIINGKIVIKAKKAKTITEETDISVIQSLKQQILEFTSELDMEKEDQKKLSGLIGDATKDDATKEEINALRSFLGLSTT